MRKEAPILSCFHVTVTNDRPQDGGALLDDVSLDVAHGQWCEIVGRGSSGKSMLFRVLSLRMKPTRGKLVVDGRNLDRLGPRGIADVRRTMASCAQAPELLEERTVIENMILPAVVRGAGEEAVEEAERLLAEVDAGPLRDIACATLSAQERTVVGVLRALVGHPRVVLLDGALDALDSTVRTRVLHALQKRHRDGSAVVLFGREPTENARRGRQWAVASGRVQAVEHPHHQARVPAPSPSEVSP